MSLKDAIGKKAFQDQDGIVTGAAAATQQQVSKKPEPAPAAPSASKCKGYRTSQIKKFRIAGQREPVYVTDGCYEPRNPEEEKIWKHFVKLGMAQAPSKE